MAIHGAISDGCQMQKLLLSRSADSGQPDAILYNPAGRFEGCAEISRPSELATMDPSSSSLPSAIPQIPMDKLFGSVLIGTFLGLVYVKYPVQHPF